MDWDFTLDHTGAFLLAAVPGLINLLLAIYVFFWLPKRLMTYVFGLMLLSSVGWQVAVALMSISANIATALFFDNVLAPVSFFSAPLILHLTWLLRNYGSVPRKRMPLLVIAYASIFVLAMIYPEVNTSNSYIYSEYWGWLNTRQESDFYAVLGLFLHVQYIGVIFLLINNIKKESADKKRKHQLLLVTIPFIIVIVQSFITEGLFPVFGLGTGTGYFH